MTDYLSKKADTLKISTRIGHETIEDLERFMEIIEDTTGQEISGDRVLIESLLDAALSKKKPIEVSKREDVETIERLTKKVSELERQLESGNSEHSAIKAENEALTIKNEALVSENEALTNTLNGIMEKGRTENGEKINYVPEPVYYPDGDVIPVRLSEPHKTLLNEYLASDFVKKKFAENARKMVAFKPIDTTDSTENAQNFMLNVFVGSAQEMHLTPLRPKREIEKLFRQSLF